MLGDPGSPWIARMIEAVVEGSHRAGRVAMTDDVAEVMQEVRDFMFERVYLRPEAEAQRRQAIRVIRGLVDHYLENPGEIPDSYRQHAADTVTQVLDYVSGMTDRFALADYDRVCRTDGYS
jgi:dGTPase